MPQVCRDVSCPFACLGCEEGFFPDPNNGSGCVSEEDAVGICAGRVCGEDCDVGLWCTEVAVDETVCVSLSVCVESRALLENYGRAKASGCERWAGVGTGQKARALDVYHYIITDPHPFSLDRSCPFFS